MADFYVDHGAYGTTSNRPGLDNPTWGVPQEGDGFSTAAATATAVAEIKINASPTASETIVIAGATITAAASAGANAFVRGANPDATATNIVTLINSTSFTATVSTNVVSTGGLVTNANQGRNLFFARVKPGATDTVQIMWRIGSEALNHANNSNVAITTSGWGTAPTITQFAGGTSGCWGWLINDVAFGQGSSIDQGQYGVLGCKPTIVRNGNSTTYAVTEADTIWLRTGGSVQQATVALGGSNRSRVSAGPDFVLVADTNTKWTGDSDDGTFTINVTNTGLNLTWGLANNNNTTLQALRFGGLVISVLPLTGTNIFLGVVQTGQLNYRNLILEEHASTGATSEVRFFGPLGNTNAFWSAENCLVHHKVARSVIRTQATVNVASYLHTFRFNGVEFRFNYTGTSAPNTPLFLAQASSVSAIQFTARDCRVTGLGAYKAKFLDVQSPLTVNQQNVNIIIENVQGADVGSTGFSMWYTLGKTGDVEIGRQAFISSADVGGSWRYESSIGASDWVYGSGFPTLSALIADIGEPQSVRHYWLVGTGAPPFPRGYQAPPLRRRSRGSTATKTITLRMFVPSSITFDAKNFGVLFSYIDNAGSLQTQWMTGASVVSDGSTWTNAGSYPSYAARRLEFTTPTSVKQGTDVTATVFLMGPSPTDSLAYLFVDPAMGIA